MDSDDDTEINPFSMLLLSNPSTQNDAVLPPPEQPHDHLQTREYYFQSIKSTVVIQQLPSQGLSFQLWPAATTLVTLLDNRSLSAFLPPNRRLKILELGSGTGLLGIAAAAILSADVTVTDLPHVIPNLEFNVEANSDVVLANNGCVHVAALGWGEIQHMKKLGRDYDVILGSDVVYHDHLYEPLIETLKYMKSVFVMAHLKRWKKESTFFKKAKKFFDVEVLYTENPSTGSRVGVIVYKFNPKS